MGRWRRWLGKRKAQVQQQVRLVLAQMGYYSRPGFLILGAQKCGTVALFNYLAQHPRIRPGLKKEISFFNKDGLYQRGFTWYHSHFPVLGTGITFEGTPEYLYHPQCAGRIHTYNPSIKLIVLLRDPVERAFSAWNMFRVLHRDRPEYLHTRSRTANPATRTAISEMLTRDDFYTFAEVVQWEIEHSPAVQEQPEPSFIRRGLYAQQLQRYLNSFPRTQLLVIQSKRLRTETVTVLDKVTAFLGLPRHKWETSTLAPRHVGRYEGATMAPKTRRLLARYYAPHNDALYTLLGRDFGW